MCSDFAIYGLCPARDEFYLVVCEICGVLVKPQALQQHTGIVTCIIVNNVDWTWWQFGLAVTVLYISEVTLHQAGLLLGWVTVRMYTILVFNQSPSSTQPGHSSVGRHNKYWQ